MVSDEKAPQSSATLGLKSGKPSIAPHLLLFWGNPFNEEIASHDSQKGGVTNWLVEEQKCSARRSFVIAIFFAPCLCAFWSDSCSLSQKINDDVLQ